MDPSSPISPEARAFLESKRPTRLPLLPITAAIARRIRGKKAAQRAPMLASLQEELVASCERRTLGDVHVTVVAPRRRVEARSDVHALYVHGGGFLYGAGLDTSSILMADLLGVPVHGIEYSLSPEARYPKALDEVSRVYRASIEAHAPERTVVFGVSAGGNLVVSALLRALEDGLPMPAAVGLFTPWADLSGTGDSHRGNDGRDPVIGWTNSLDKAARAYMGAGPAADPGISPVRAAFDARFPPTIITTGTRDLLLSDCVQLAEALRDGGAEVCLRIWEGMWHAVNVERNIPEGRQMREAVAAFLGARLD